MARGGGRRRGGAGAQHAILGALLQIAFLAMPGAVELRREFMRGGDVQSLAPGQRAAARRDVGLASPQRQPGPPRPPRVAGGAKVFIVGRGRSRAMATEAVEQEGFIGVGGANSVMLCTEMTALAGSDATADAVDASVLAAAPVPEGSLIPVDSVTSSERPGADGLGGGAAPPVKVRVTCRNARIHGVVDRCHVHDRETRRPRAHVWVFRVTNRYGETRDYRFRAQLDSMGSYGDGDEHDVVTVFLTSLDRRPVVTEV